DRTRAASQAQVAKIASGLDFRLLGASPLMDFGAPTLASSGAIVGGNGRAMAIARAYEQGSAGDYRDRLLANLPQFGIDPEAAAKRERPALVRVLQSDVNVRQAALASNEGAGMKMSLLEQSAVDAERLPPMAGFFVPESGDLNVPANRDFVMNWISRYP